MITELKRRLAMMVLAADAHVHMTTRTDRKASIVSTRCAFL
tara:strand:- start:1809 stop:1931 length:123 start_codon:yes stop_codon:yes gene_type:complete